MTVDAAWKDSDGHNSPLPVSAASCPILAIDFDHEGHHALHVCHLVRHGRSDVTVDIRFLLPRELREAVRQKLLPEEYAYFVSRLQVLEEHAAWVRLTGWIKNRRLARWIFIEHLNRSQKDRRLLFLFLESVIYAVALSPLSRGNIAGVMFRPTFHYRNRGMLAPGLRTRALFATKYAVALILARRPGISRVFVLDPLAADYANSKWGSSKFRLIPDPVGPSGGTVRPLGSTDAVEQRPLNMLIAGALAPRKGIHWTVDALSKCHHVVRRNLCLFLIGKPEPGQSDYVTANIERLKSLGVSVTAELRFVGDSELDEYISRSHLVLTPYTGFTGSSGIIIQAAHFGKPVLSTNDGLLGYLVRKHQLGEAVKVTDSEVFAQWLEQFASTGGVSGFNPPAARAFADSCDPGLYAVAVIR